MPSGKARVCGTDTSRWRLPGKENKIDWKGSPSWPQEKLKCLDMTQDRALSSLMRAERMCLFISRTSRASGMTTLEKDQAVSYETRDNKGKMAAENIRII